MYVSPDIPICRSLNHRATLADLHFLREDAWLMDTEVMYNIIKHKGMWELTMIYVAVEDPMKLICRKIDRYYSEKRARIFADIFQRGIRKDARGTLKTDKNAFNICHN